MEALVIIAGLVFGFGFLKSLRKEDRTVVVTSAVNTSTIGVTYAFKTLYRSFKLILNSGQGLGALTELQGQDGLTALDDYNKDIKKKGGATKVGFDACTDHGKNLGLTDAYKSVEDWSKEVQRQLDEARAKRNNTPTTTRKESNETTSDTTTTQSV